MVALKKIPYISMVSENFSIFQNKLLHMRNPSQPYSDLDTIYRISVIKKFVGIDFTFTNKVFIKLMKLNYEN